MGFDGDLITSLSIPDIPKPLMSLWHIQKLQMYDKILLGYFVNLRKGSYVTTPVACTVKKGSNGL